MDEWVVIVGPQNMWIKICLTDCELILNMCQTRAQFIVGGGESWKVSTYFQTNAKITFIKGTFFYTKK